MGGVAKTTATAAAVSGLAALVAALTAGAVGADPVPPEPVPPEPVLVFPGMEIHQDSHLCTLGYVDRVRRVGYTAGHCRGDGGVTDVDGRPIGGVADSQNNTPGGTSVSTDQVITDYEVIALADDVATNDILPDGRRLESDPGLQLHPGDPVCHFGVASGESCGTVESVNNGWFTMSRGIATQRGDSGGPVYVVGDPGPARIVGVFTSTWGDYPAAVSWAAVPR